MTIPVYITIYKGTDDDDPKHWTIYMRNDPESVLLQSARQVGRVGFYVHYPIYNKEPESSSRFEEAIQVGNITSDDAFYLAITHIQAQPVNSVSTTWNCQAWVMEALDSVEKKGLFSWYKEAKKKVEGKRQLQKQ